MDESPSVNLADEGLQWLDQLLEAETPPDKPAMGGPPPLPRQSVVPTGDAIDVDIRWLIRVPSREGRRNANGPPRTLPSVPSPVGMTAPGKLPPPLPCSVSGVFAKVRRVLAFEKE
jgi:hypothetical protein